MTIPMSSIERELTVRVANLENAFCFLAQSISQQLPASHSQLDGLVSQLKTMGTEASENANRDILVGNGPVATSCRRSLDHKGSYWIEKGLPKPYMQAEEVSKTNIAHRMRTLVNYYLQSRSVTVDDSYFWDIDGLVPADATYRLGGVETFRTPAVGEYINGFFFQEDKHDYNRKKQWILTIDVSDALVNNRSMIRVNERGQIEITTYVPLEQMWVHHRNLEYVDFDRWEKNLHRLMKEWGLLPEKIYTSEAVRQTLNDLIVERGFTHAMVDGEEWSLPRVDYPYQSADVPPHELSASFSEIPGKHEPRRLVNRYQVRQGKGNLAFTWHTDLKEDKPPTITNFNFHGHWYGMSSLNEAAWDCLPIRLRHRIMSQFIAGLNLLSPPDHSSDKPVETTEADAIE